MVKKAKLSFLCAAFLSCTASSWAGPMLAVASSDQGAVVFFNVTGGGLYLSQIASVHVGVHPGEMCLAPDENQLYVNTRGEKGAVIVDVATQTVQGVLKAPGLDEPDSCVVSPDSKKVYVVDPAAASVFVFSAETKQFETEIHVGKEPRRVIFTPDHKYILVSNSQANTLSVISAADNKVVRTIKTGNEPRDMVFSPDGKLLAVTLIDDDSVEFFKADTLEFKEQVGAIRSPQHLGFTPDSQRLYIVGKITDEVAVMHIGNHSRVDFTIPVNRGPLGVMCSWGFAMTPDAQFLFVTNLGEGTVSILDTRSMKTFRAFSAGQSAIDVVYIKAKGGTAGLNSNARIEHYRALAKQAVDEVKKGNFAAATKLARDLEQQWDDSEGALRKKSPEVWGQVDEALDDFINPIIHANGKVPSDQKLNSVYNAFLEKLALIH